MALAVAVAARPATEGGARGEAVLAVAAAGVLLLVVALVLARGSLVAWSLLALAAAYAVGLARRDSDVDAAAPLVATGLLLVAELGYWSVELAGTAREEPAVALRRLAALGALALGALALATLVLAAAAAPLGAAAGWNAVGVAAAAAVIALLARLAQRPDAKADK